MELKHIVLGVLFSCFGGQLLAQHRHTEPGFGWSHYKYVVVEQGSFLAFAPKGGIAPWPEQNGDDPDMVEVKEDIFEDIKKCFKHFTNENAASTQGCIALIPDQFDYIGKFEQAVAFIKLFVTEDEMIQLDLYDVTLGWSAPVLSIKWQEEDVSSAAKKDGKIAVLREHAEGLSDRLPTRYAKFDMAQSNNYFLNTDLTAKTMLASDPSRTGKPELSKKVYPNVMLSVVDNLSSLKSVFILGLNSTKCDGTSSSADGLAQLAALKLMNKYTLLERSQLEALIEEQKLGASGLVEESTIVDLGKIQGSDGIVLCQESCVGGSPMQTVKLLNCVTGEQEWIASSFDSNAINIFEAILQELE